MGVNKINILKDDYEKIVEFDWLIGKEKLYQTSALTSPTIVCGDLEWELSINGFVDEETERNIYLSLKENYGVEKVIIQFAFLSTSRQVEVMERLGRKLRYESVYQYESVFTRGQHYIIDTCKTKYIGGYSPPDDPVRKIDLRIRVTREPGSNRSLGTQNFSKNDKFLYNIENLCLAKELSDVTISTSGEEFQAHKVILASRSDIFKSMFSHDMRENKENKVDLSYMEADVVKEMLKYIYTGQSPFEERSSEDTSIEQHITIELFKVADKFQLGDLKMMCASYLSENLSVDSAAEMLALANLYSIKELKETVFRFIKTNMDEVIKTEGWLGVMKNSGELVNELLVYLHKRA